MMINSISTGHDRRLFLCAPSGRGVHVRTSFRRINPLCVTMNSDEDISQIRLM